MGKLLTVELGEGSVGLITQVNGSTLCVAAPEVLTDPPKRRAMQDLVRRHGGDCGSCRGCPLGGHRGS
jgi:hypothetical protein